MHPLYNDNEVVTDMMSRLELLVMDLRGTLGLGHKDTPYYFLWSVIRIGLHGPHGLHGLFGLVYLVLHFNFKSGYDFL